MTDSNKKTIFSGVQPSGNLHIGNYIGALSQWAELQNQYDCIFCVVDYHAITVKQDPKELNKRIIEIVKHYLASGIDPKKSVIFQQSDVSAHTELAWILNTIARNSDLTKMTQFKEKSGIQTGVDDADKILDEMTGKNFGGFNDILAKWVNKKELTIEEVTLLRSVIITDIGIGLKKFNSVGVGLYDYPVLMASDILLYDTDAVPVGDDQVQHVELTRTLARRFNQQFGETFKVPEVVIRKEGARIMGLDDPKIKMSKSAASTANYIALSDSPEAAAKKIMRAVTDSGKDIRFDKTDKPAISNLLTIYSVLGKTSIRELENKYKNKGYSDFKKDLAEAVKIFLINYQKKFNRYSDDEIKNILKAGAARIEPLAKKTLLKTKKQLGLYIKK
jgi:tryptophanyl-tRNA synthetase